MSFAAKVRRKTNENKTTFINSLYRTISARLFSFYSLNLVKRRSFFPAKRMEEETNGNRRFGEMPLVSSIFRRGKLVAREKKKNRNFSCPDTRISKLDHFLFWEKQRCEKKKKKKKTIVEEEDKIGRRRLFPIFLRKRREEGYVVARVRVL